MALDDQLPAANLLVIRSAEMHRAVEFYRALGLEFQLHSHGGPEHYSAELSGFVFEVYPQRNEQDETCRIRLGFAVKDVDALVEALMGQGVEVVSAPTNTPWGRRAVVKDFDGHTVELTNGPC